MADTSQSRNQSSVISGEIAAVAVHLASHLRGRLLDISLTVQRDGVVIGGRAGSYYVKQLAQHAVMSGVSLPIAANDIEVIEASEAPRGHDAVARSTLGSGEKHAKHVFSRHLPDNKGSFHMFMNPIYMTDQDHLRLTELIDDCRLSPNGHASSIDALEREVKRACTVEKTSISGDVVTMNSTVRLRDMDSGENEVYTLVYPTMADPEDDRISVLAPVGTAIVGSRVGDLIEWPVPAGIRHLLVEDILYQPERAGDHDL